MGVIEVTDGTTVANHQILKAPFITQNGLQQALRTATGVVVKALVSTHHLANLCILHQCLKGRHIGLPHITGRHIGQIGRMAGILRTAMYGIVLGTGPEFTVFGIFRSLQSLDNLRSHDTGQIGILTIGFLSPAPSRVTEDIDIRRPYREAVELLVLAAIQHAVVILGTELGTRGIEHLI